MLKNVWGGCGGWWGGGGELGGGVGVGLDARAAGGRSHEKQCGANLVVKGDLLKNRWDRK